MEVAMCRNIRPLFNYDPVVTEEEIRASALQYVRKVSGYTKPSQANEAAFNDAVARVSGVTPRFDRVARHERARKKPRSRG
jgi:hypothetical protein